MRRSNFAVLCLLVAASLQPAKAALSNAIFTYSDANLADTKLLLTLTSGPLLLNAVDRGWYDQTGHHDADNLNYLAGFCGTSDECLNEDDLDYRNFFTFDLKGVSGLILGAQLQLAMPAANGYISSQPALKYSNFDVSTAVPALLSGSGGTSAYDDLGNGVVFGSRFVTNASQGTNVLVNLNSAALASIQASLGGDWALGGRVDISAVPEPGTLPAGGTALAVLIWLGRRRPSL